MLNWGITSGCIVSPDFIRLLGPLLDSEGQGPPPKRIKKDYLKCFPFGCSNFLFMLSVIR